MSVYKRQYDLETFEMTLKYNIKKSAMTLYHEYEMDDSAIMVSYEKKG